MTAQEPPFAQSISTTVVVPKVFTPGECLFIRSLSKDFGMRRAGVYDENAKNLTTYSNHRTCSNCWIDLLPETEWIYSKILKEATRVNYNFFKFDFDNFERATLLRYKPFQQFKWHIDVHNGQRQRKLTCVVNLSNPKEYVGGELQVESHWENHEFAKDQGSAIFFPSFLRHRAKAPLLGTRWSLVLWHTGEPWK